MSSEMREVEVLLNKWLVRYNELIQMDRTNEAEQVLRCINEGKRALLARTEAGADGAIYQMMATDEDVDEDGNVRPDDPRMWMDHSREEYERLNNHPSVRSRIVYTHPQDASGDAVDWKWQYRFQTVMRFMDNGATREAAERAALIDIAALESAAMQAKEAK